MAKDMFEIRFHGRGGEGAKTAAALLAEAAFEHGKYVQSFPEYGAERQGAPVKSFTRISDSPILVHSGITHPDVVVVIDPTLVKHVPVADGLSEDGILIINTVYSPEDVKGWTGFEGKIIAFNGTKIALETIQKPIANIALLGVLVKATKVVSLEILNDFVVTHFAKKYGQEFANKNAETLNRAYNEVNV